MPALPNTPTGEAKNPWQILLPAYTPRSSPIWSFFRGRGIRADSPRAKEQYAFREKKKKKIGKIYIRSGNFIDMSTRDVSGSLGGWLSISWLIPVL